MTLSLLTTAGALGALIADERIPDPDSVTPGIIGFIVTFGIAIVTLLLVIDMVRRVRRVNLRAQVREELEAEIAARDAAADGTADGAAAPTDPEAGPPSR
jgi:TRAP-type C4-dicarboxylate transport system permease small subunit